VARLLQLGVIPPTALEEKYKNDIFANEFVLLSYYIAPIDIEQVYHQVRTEQGLDEGYVEFPGMTLTDIPSTSTRATEQSPRTSRAWPPTTSVRRRRRTRQSQSSS